MAEKEISVSCEIKKDNSFNMFRLTLGQINALHWCIEQASDWRGSLDLDDVEQFDKQIKIANETLGKIKKNNSKIIKLQKNKSK